ncbi:unnamed protein product [Chrysoparadoxa australica]
MEQADPEISQYQEDCLSDPIGDQLAELAGAIGTMPSMNTLLGDTMKAALETVPQSEGPQKAKQQSETGTEPSNESHEEKEAEPSWSMSESGSASAGDRSLTLKVCLEKAANLDEAAVDVSTTSLRLTVPGRYHLSLELPFPVEASSAKAKFSRKKKELRFSAPELISR